MADSARSKGLVGDIAGLFCRPWEWDFFLMVEVGGCSSGLEM
jgi:hypothetical protein